METVSAPRRAVAELPPAPYAGVRLLYDCAVQQPLRHTGYCRYCRL